MGMCRGPETRADNEQAVGLRRSLSLSWLEEPGSAVPGPWGRDPGSLSRAARIQVRSRKPAETTTKQLLLTHVRDDPRVLLHKTVWLRSARGSKSNRTR